MLHAQWDNSVWILGSYKPNVICVVCSSLTIGHMEDRPMRSDKANFFPSSGRINTAVWMHHMNADFAYEGKLDGNCTIMLRAIVNKSWRQHPTKQQLYRHLPPILKTIQIRRTRYAGHC